jgi:hypothetical protein
MLQHTNAMYNAGNDFIPNDLIDRNIVADGMTEDQIYAMLVENKARVEGHGWKRASAFYVYNNNAYNQAAVNALTRAGYKCARAGTTDGYMMFVEGGMNNPFRLPSYGFDGKELAEFQTMLTRVIEYQAGVIIYFHNPYRKSKIVYDGQPAVTAGETPSQWCVANAAYCTANAIGGGSIWYENLEEMVALLASKVASKEIVVLSPSEWMQAAGL